MVRVQCQLMTVHDQGLWREEGRRDGEGRRGEGRGRERRGGKGMGERGEGSEGGARGQLLAIQ